MPGSDLEQLLTGRIAAEALKPTMDYSSMVPNEYPIRKALTMLHDVQFPVPSRVVMDDPKMSMNSRTVANRSGVQHLAHVNPAEEGLPVHVNASTETYGDARSGNPKALRELASVLAHEAQHQTGGPDEQAAYRRQIDALTALGAKNGEVNRVREIAAYVARIQGR